MKLVTLLLSSILAAFVYQDHQEKALPAPNEDWIHLGVVGVDSGQLALLDPAYVSSEWILDGQGDEWKVLYWGRDEAELTPEFGSSPIACESAEAAAKLDASIQSFCKSNELLAVTWVQSGSTYEKCCELTANGLGGGQLTYRRGHAGLGVALSTAYGDGTYSVYARRGEDGEILEVRVFFGVDDPAEKRLREQITKKKRR